MSCAGEFTPAPSYLDLEQRLAAAEEDCARLRAARDAAVLVAGTKHGKGCRDQTLRAMNASWQMECRAIDAEKRLSIAVSERRSLEVRERDTMAKLAEAESRLAEAERVLREIASSGVSFSDTRIRYVEVQIDCETWDAARAFLDREVGK